MAASYRAQGIVLRRTKLGETDLIITILSDAPSQVRAVAKGARKPGSRLAGVVDLGNEASFLLHRGRSLDVVTEARLVSSCSDTSCDIERSSMVAAVLDIAAELTAEGEHDPRLLPLTRRALEALREVPLGRMALVAAAYALKACAMQGFRPSLAVCVRCGEDVPLSCTAAQAPARRYFSLAEGGVVCGACHEAAGEKPVDAAILAWCQSLLGMRFDDIVSLEPLEAERSLGYDLLEFAAEWLGHYPGVRPRALDFVLHASW